MDQGLSGRLTSVSGLVGGCRALGLRRGPLRLQAEVIAELSATRSPGPGCTENVDHVQQPPAGRAAAVAFLSGESVVALYGHLEDLGPGHEHDSGLGNRERPYLGFAGPQPGIGELAPSARVVLKLDVEL